MTSDAAVLVPVRAFAVAKSRLAPALTASARSEMARAMATTVVHAAGGLPVTVVCDDDEVATWAAGVGAAVVWAPEPGLDAAVQVGIESLSASGIEVAVVAHADLPYASRLDALVRFDGITLVPDRHDDGTNVVVVPLPLGFRFAYGPGSFRRHLAEAHRVGAPLRISRQPRLQWDVDTPDDLPTGSAPTFPRVAAAACR